MIKVTPTEQAALDNHFLRCNFDYPYYASKNQMIQNKKNELVYFQLNEVQMILEEIWQDIEKAGRRIRLNIVKGRKQGISTWFDARGSWMIVGKGRFKKDANGVVQYLGPARYQNMSIIAHDPSTTETLFGIVKRIDENLHPEFQYPKAKDNEHILWYKAPVDAKNPASLDSTILVGTANVKDFGSGMTLTISHRSELAKWPAENVDDLLLSLNNAMPDSPLTATLNESTAKGIGNTFHKEFTDSRYIYEVFQDKNQVPYWTMKLNENADEDNEYSSIFIPWYITKEYTRPVRENFQLTIEEKMWKEKYNLTDEQIQWYRYALNTLCSRNRNNRQQEYPFTSLEAFLSSGTPSFELERIIRLKDECPPPIARYDCLLSGGQFIAAKQGYLQVWEEPARGTSYLISADVSEGLEHGDFDSADVFEHLTGVQVAHFHGKMSPFEYASLLFYIGKRYNEAWLCPERNNHGMSVIQELVRLEYENLYVEVIVEPPNKPRKRFGWLTTEKSRALILDNLKQIVGEDNPGICCTETYEEMMNFKRQKDGREEADSGTFDDRVLSVAIGKHLIKTLDCVIVRSKNPSGDGSGRAGKQKRPDKRALMGG